MRKIDARLSEIGEKRLVKSILENLDAPEFLLGGVGNDAATLDPFSDNFLIAACVDKCPTPLAFSLGLTGTGIFGRLVIVANASDLMACGAKPWAFLLSLGLKKDMKFGQVRDIIESAKKTAIKYNAYVVGGDTKETNDLVIFGTGLGVTRKDQYLIRSGARVGDIIAVTGNLGVFSAGALILTKKIAVDRKICEKLMKPIFTPEAAYKEATIVATTKSATAGMDLSDGLPATLYGISEKSGIAIEVYEEKIPTTIEVEKIARILKIPHTRLCLGVGDWQILYTIKPQAWPLLKVSIEKVGGKITAIGRAIKGEGVKIRLRNGSAARMRRLEQEHFTEQSFSRDYLYNLVDSEIYE